MNIRIANPEPSLQVPIRGVNGLARAGNDAELMAFLGITAQDLQPIDYNNLSSPNADDKNLLNSIAPKDGWKEQGAQEVDPSSPTGSIASPILSSGGNKFLDNLNGYLKAKADSGAKYDLNHKTDSINKNCVTCLIEFGENHLGLTNLKDETLPDGTTLQDVAVVSAAAIEKLKEDKIDAWNDSYTLENGQTIEGHPLAYGYGGVLLAKGMGTALKIDSLDDFKNMSREEAQKLVEKMNGATVNYLKGHMAVLSDVKLVDKPDGSFDITYKNTGANGNKDGPHGGFNNSGFGTRDKTFSLTEQIQNNNALYLVIPNSDIQYTGTA